MFLKTCWNMPWIEHWISITPQLLVFSSPLRQLSTPLAPLLSGGAVREQGVASRTSCWREGLFRWPAGSNKKCLNLVITLRTCWTYKSFRWNNNSYKSFYGKFEANEPRLKSCNNKVWLNFRDFSLDYTRTKLKDLYNDWKQINLRKLSSGEFLNESRV